MIAVLKQVMRELEIYRNNHKVLRRRAEEWREKFPEDAIKCAIEAEGCYRMTQHLQRAQSALIEAVRFKHRNEPGFKIEEELLK